MAVVPGGAFRSVKRGRHPTVAGCLLVGSWFRDGRILWFRQAQPPDSVRGFRDAALPLLKRGYDPLVSTPAMIRRAAQPPGLRGDDGGGCCGAHLDQQGIDALDNVQQLAGVDGAGDIIICIGSGLNLTEVH